MRRFVNQIVFSIVAVSICIVIALMIGANIRWAGAIGVVIGGLVYFFVATLVIRRSDLQIIRSELERLGYTPEDDSDEAPSESSGKFTSLRFLISHPFVMSKPSVFVMATDMTHDIRDRSLHIWIEVPDHWPDFTIMPAHSVMERPKLGMQATNSGFAHPDFDRQFRVETGDLYEIEKHLNRSVQERLLVLPPRSQIACDAGVLTIETGPILPLDAAKIVQACESLADPSALKPGARR